MFTLQDVIDSLAYGELSQLDAGNQFTRCGIESGVDPKEIPRLISFINMGLLQLYTKFNLSTKQLRLRMQGIQTSYHLSSKYALSNTESTEVKYIIDRPDMPFTDDILMVEGVYNECGCWVPIGDMRACETVAFPTWDYIQVRTPQDQEDLVIIYKAKPDHIKPDAPMDTVVELPASLWECLNFYVAGKYFARNSTTQEISNINMVRFANRVADIQKEHIFGNQYGTTSVLLDKQGWA